MSVKDWSSKLLRRRGNRRYSNDPDWFFYLFFGVVILAGFWVGSRSVESTKSTLLNGEVDVVGIFYPCGVALVVAVSFGRLILQTRPPRKGMTGEESSELDAELRTQLESVAASFMIPVLLCYLYSSIFSVQLWIEQPDSERAEPVLVANALATTLIEYLRRALKFRP